MQTRKHSTGERSVREEEKSPSSRAPFHRGLDSASIRREALGRQSSFAPATRCFVNGAAGSRSPRSAGMATCGTSAGASRKPCPPCSHPPAYPGRQNNQMSRRQLVPLLRRHLRSDRSEPLRRSGSVALTKCALKIKASLSEGKKSRRMQTADSGNVQEKQEAICKSSEPSLPGHSRRRRAAALSGFGSRPLSRNRRPQPRSGARLGQPGPAARPQPQDPAGGRAGRRLVPGRAVPPGGPGSAAGPPARPAACAGPHGSGPAGPRRVRALPRSQPFPTGRQGPRTPAEGPPRTLGCLPPGLSSFPPAQPPARPQGQLLRSVGPPG